MRVIRYICRIPTGEGGAVKNGTDLRRLMPWKDALIMRVIRYNTFANYEKLKEG